jgi:superfamily II DNA/RNA helicase
MKRKAGIHELLDLESQNKSLEAFRVKQKHIIIATDVLEEGIDVAACNLVVCFDPPQNLKSFIQRRGRARKKQSRFVIMQPYTSKKTKTDRWIQLEEQVSRLCQDEKRARETVLSVEDQDEILDLVLHDRSTGY